MLILKLQRMNTVNTDPSCFEKKGFSFFVSRKISPPTAFLGAYTISDVHIEYKKGYLPSIFILQIILQAQI